VVRGWYSKNCRSVFPRIVNQFVETALVNLFDVSSSDKNVQTVVNGLFRQASPIHENRRRASPSLKLIEDFSVLTG